jgi:uncharacterized protein
MVLDLVNLPEGTTEQDFSETPEELDLRKDICRFEKPVTIRLIVQKSKDDLVAEGRVATEGLATCVRCLEDFKVVVEESFRVIVRIVPDAEAREDTGDEDYIAVPQSEPCWDTSGLFRELIHLAIPDHPLCRDGCAGLCAGCGRNLNDEQCVCREKVADGPLGRLRDMLKGAEGSKERSTDH